MHDPRGERGEGGGGSGDNIILEKTGATPRPVCACVRVSCGMTLVGGRSLAGSIDLENSVDIATCTGICAICVTNELDYCCTWYDVISFLRAQNF